MTFVRTCLAIAALTTTTLAIPALAANDASHDSHHRTRTTTVQLAQAAPGGGMGMRTGTPMPAHTEQMKAMQDMHEQMQAARTPEERSALMAAHMALMQNGMNMMGGMGGMGHMAGGAMPGKPGDNAARQRMMEQRVDMMQSMMQLMMDRMQSAPATK